MSLKKIFKWIDGAHIAVIGDFCLDVYWTADMTKSELSREVPHFPLPIIEERMSPGGAGNVVCNICALKPQKVSAIGMIGCDWRGDALKRLLANAGADVSALIASFGRITSAYIKPLRKGISGVIYEDPRLDFENHTPIPTNEEQLLLDALNKMDADVICVCDQLKFGCITPRIRARLCEMGRSGRRIIVDSRDRIALYQNVIVKPNEVEASRVVQFDGSYEEIVQRLSRKTGKPAIITLGEQGCLLCENDHIHHAAAQKIDPPIDICGAGDTFLSALACALSCDTPMTEAVAFANTASAVTIRKLNMTGTASRKEISALCR